MSRRRYISTEISSDPDVAELAIRAKWFAALLYTWLIPHCEDDATFKGSVNKIKLQVLPGVPASSEDIHDALAAMHDQGLVYWNRDTQVIYYPPESFYKYQTYVPPSKRRTWHPGRNERLAAPLSANFAEISEDQRTTPTNAELRRETPENTASPSPSPSPSLSPSLSLSPAPVGAVEPVKNEYTPEFEAFWSAYPRRVEKRAAYKCWRARLKDKAAPDDLIRAAANYAADCERLQTEERFRKHPATFLGPSRPYEEYMQARAAPVTPAAATSGVRTDAGWLREIERYQHELDGKPS